MTKWMPISSLTCCVALWSPTSPAVHAAADGCSPQGSPLPAPPVSTTLGPVNYPRSMAYRFQSKIVDDVYELRVAVPEDYELDEGLRPVIYALDGQWNFTLLSDIVGKLAWDGSIPDPIVVGITWADAGFQPAAKRQRDFTPEPIPGVPGSGGAARFLSVLENEVFALVESSYRASADRVITGGSAGGLFVSYALLERPDLFSGYVASSGATSLAPDYFTRRLSEISPELLRDERAYFSVGALYDNEPDVAAFVAALKAVAGDTPKLVVDVVPGVGHTGNETFGYLRGLLHAFQRPRLPLPASFLERYEGDYFEPAAPDLPDLTIEAGDGELYVYEGGDPWGITFYAATPTHFYAEGIDIDLTFYEDEEGQLAFALNVRRQLYTQVRR